MLRMNWPLAQLGDVDDATNLLARITGLTVINANSGSLAAQVITDFYVDHSTDPQIIIDVLYQAA